MHWGVKRVEEMQRLLEAVRCWTMVDRYDQKEKTKENRKFCLISDL